MSQRKGASEPPTPKTNTSSCQFPLLFVLFIPIAAAALVYQLDSFHPSPIPYHELEGDPVPVPLRSGHMLKGSEFVGSGQLLGPEDFAYDADSRLLYTGCLDGWVKRVTVNDSVVDMVVENWVNTGGRPLGLALDRNKDLIVADAYKGLLKITRDGSVELLTDEAEGVKFKFTDGVDIDHDDGIIYFTDASYKYNYAEVMLDILEGKPHGRLMSFDPKTKHTRILVPNLYFANGVAVSPDQNSVIFCETPMRRCWKYYTRGKSKGSLEKFIDNIPGLPDNIRYDGQSHYWIGISSDIPWWWNSAVKYPFIRKIMGMVERYIGLPKLGKNGGIMMVDLEGKPMAQYYDTEFSMITGGIKIGNHVYYGSIVYPFILRLNLSTHS